MSEGADQSIDTKRQSIAIDDQNVTDKQKPEKLSPDQIELDKAFAQETIKQLLGRRLSPDGKTSYIFDGGIGHGIYTAKQLEQWNVASQIIVDESTSSPTSIRRMQNSLYTYGMLEEIDNPNGKNDYS